MRISIKRRHLIRFLLIMKVWCVGEEDECQECEILLEPSSGDRRSLNLPSVFLRPRIFTNTHIFRDEIKCTSYCPMLLLIMSLIPPGLF